MAPVCDLGEHAAESVKCCLQLRYLCTNDVTTAALLILESGTTLDVHPPEY
jgi:hypothetical protein